MDIHPTRDEFGKYTKKLEIDHRVCFICKSDKTYVKKNGGKDWRCDKYNNILCKKCWLKFVDYPTRGRIMRDRYNPYRLNYPGKTIIYRWLKRLGICHDCCAVVGINCKKTDWHHAKGYVRIFPWYGLLELCPSCHDFEKWRLGEFTNNTGWYQRLNPVPRDRLGRFSNLVTI